MTDTEVFLLAMGIIYTVPYLNLAAAAHRLLRAHKHLITDGMFTALLLMALASTMLTVPVVAPGLARARAMIVRIA
jgi:hypothetical protein